MDCLTSDGGRQLTSDHWIHHIMFHEDHWQSLERGALDNSVPFHNYYGSQYVTFAVKCKGSMEIQHFCDSFYGFHYESQLNCTIGVPHNGECGVTDCTGYFIKGSSTFPDSNTELFTLHVLAIVQEVACQDWYNTLSSILQNFLLLPSAAGQLHSVSKTLKGNTLLVSSTQHNPRCSCI